MPSSSGKWFLGKSVPIIMSPTAAILIRNSLLSGSGGRVGFGAGAGSVRFTATGGAGSSGVVVAQAVSANAARKKQFRTMLVTDPNAKYVYLRATQPAAQHVEFVKIFGRPYVNAVVILVINLDALNV
jgi:hypothetical protein